tara:strand:- start:2168 stop:2401 length:234 start_codon:yes stop_codon:yes gene_type:complete
MTNFFEDAWQQAQDWYYGRDGSQDTAPNQETSQNVQSNTEQADKQQNLGDPIVPLMFVGGILIIGTGFFIYRTLKGK